MFAEECQSLFREKVVMELVFSSNEELVEQNIGTCRTLQGESLLVLTITLKIFALVALSCEIGP